MNKRVNLRAKRAVDAKNTENTMPTNNATFNYAKHTPITLGNAFRTSIGSASYFCTAAGRPSGKARIFCTPSNAPVMFDAPSRWPGPRRRQCAHVRLVVSGCTRVNFGDDAWPVKIIKRRRVHRRVSVRCTWTVDGETWYSASRNEYSLSGQNRKSRAVSPTASIFSHCTFKYQLSRLGRNFRFDDTRRIIFTSNIFTVTWSQQ